MEPVGFAVSVTQAANLCLRYGKLLHEAYKTFQHAETEVGDRLLHVARQCHVIRTQLGFMQRIEKSLSDEHKAIQAATLEAFSSRLKILVSKFNSVVKISGSSIQDDGYSVRRGRFVLLKSSLDAAIEDFDRWQRDYDPSWFLILKIASSEVDDTLSEEKRAIAACGEDYPRSSEETTILDNAQKIRDQSRPNPSHRMSVFLPQEGLRDATSHIIPYCSARYLRRPRSSKWYVVDSIKCSATGTDPNLTIRDVRTLAAQLSGIDPGTFGILKCYGVIKQSDNAGGKITSFDFVFEAPSQLSVQPCTLRSHLIERTPHTLTERCNSAKQLARSVNYVHTLGFVHKNVRPENVLDFSPEDQRLGAFFLIGFDQARIVERGTLLAGDLDWEKDIYRHPDRQGLKPKEAYVMQHDIYSLGVCLLEIGLWDSFVRYGDANEVAKATDALEMSAERFENRTPRDLKEHFVSLAQKSLPSRMGEIYTSVVVNCLTCLDSDNVDFGDESEFMDEDGVRVGVRYIEKILMKLNSLTI